MSHGACGPSEQVTLSRWFALPETSSRRPRSPRWLWAYGQTWRWEASPKQRLPLAAWPLLLASTDNEGISPFATAKGELHL